MTKTHHVAIAGAGIAGLASAIAMARCGHRVTVLEQAVAIDEVGAGLQIGPNAAHALRELGVWDALQPNTFAPQHIVIRNGWTGRTLSRIDLVNRFERRFGAPYRVAHRADLIAALLQTAQSLPAICIRTDCPVAGYLKLDDSLSVDLAHAEPLPADALIGADGIHSRIRNTLLNDGPPDYAGHAIYRALMPSTDVPEATDRHSVTLWLCPGGHVVHYPVGAGRQMNIVAVADSRWVEDGWHTRAEPAEVASHYRDIAAPLRDLLAAPASWHKWAAADRRPVSRWGEGPVTLIGDAAHPCLPYLAQGAAMALEDAVTLGQHCSATDRIETAFRNYEAARRLRTARVTRHSRTVGRLYHMRSLPALARNLVMAALPATLSLSTLSWLYGWRPDGG